MPASRRRSASAFFAQEKRPGTSSLNRKKHCGYITSHSIKVVRVTYDSVAGIVHGYAAAREGPPSTKMTTEVIRAEDIEKVFVGKSLKTRVTEVNKTYGPAETPRLFNLYTDVGQRDHVLV